MRVPRLGALFSGGLLVAGLSIDLAGTAPASDPAVPPGTRTLSKMCMAAGDRGDGTSTPLVATACQPFTDLSQILELA